jgi:hypothetical protein
MPCHAYNRCLQEADSTAKEAVLQDMLQVRSEKSDKCKQVQEVSLGSVAFEEQNVGR